MHVVSPGYLCIYTPRLCDKTEFIPGAWSSIHYFDVFAQKYIVCTAITISLSFFI